MDINAAQRAAITNPNTPGAAIKFATETNTSFGAISAGSAPGIEFDIALPIQPALETTIAEIGNIKSTLNAAAFLPSLTLFAAMNLIIKP